MNHLETLLITGGTGGIGSKIVQKLAENVNKLLLIGRKDRCQAASNFGANIEILDADLSDPVSTRSKVSCWFASQSQPKSIGIVLGASVLDNKPGSAEGELDDYAKVYAVNVLGNLAIVQGALPSMIEARHGRVMFFAGGGAAYAYPLFPAYALSKVATVRLVENLAAAYPANTGLSFVCLAPGAVDTPMLSKVVDAGGEIRTRTDISEPVNFADHFLRSTSTAMTGRYLHVRDDWGPLFNDNNIATGDKYMLRRIT